MSITLQQPIQIDRDELLALLKRFAKDDKKSHPEHPLNWFQNKIATALGFSNWAMLHKSITKMPLNQFNQFTMSVFEHSQIGPSLHIKNNAVKVFDEQVAVIEMRNWVKSKFTPLIDFAQYDNESANGYARADEDLFSEMESEFGGIYPHDLIMKVAGDLEQNNGPWGIEDYGRDDD